MKNGKLKVENDNNIGITVAHCGFNLHVSDDEIIVIRNALRLAKKIGFTDCSITDEELTILEDNIMGQYRSQTEKIRQQIESELRKKLKIKEG